MKKPQASKGASAPFSFPVNDEDFHKSSDSIINTQPGCVTVARTKKGVAIRDTKDPRKTTLFFKPHEWTAFLAGVRKGEFD